MKTEIAGKPVSGALELISDHDYVRIASRLLPSLVLLYEFGTGKIRYNQTILHAALGFAPDAVSDFFSLVHEEDLSPLKICLAAAEDPFREHIDCTCRIRSADGSFFTYNFRISRSNDDPRLAALFGEQVEIQPPVLSDKYELNHLRLVSEELLHYGTYDYDILRDSGYWSEGLYELFGYKSDRPVINLDRLLSHIVPADLEKFREAMFDYDLVARDYDIEFTIQTQDQKQKRIHVTGKRLAGADGKPYRDIGIMRDVTLQRGHENTISSIIEELQRSNKELEEFAYVASHDLQEPLRKISTFCGRLHDKYKEKFSNDGQLYLDRIMASAESMRGLIDNLLDYSRVSRVRQEFKETNLSFLLAQVMSELELKIEETRATINAAGLPVIDGSFSNLKQLFSNILNNALKFRKPGIPPIIQIKSSMLDTAEIAHLQLPGNNNYFKLRFFDNGIGFEQEYAGRIFQIFQRLHGKSDYPGSGIGLAICKKIVDQHKGLIWAENIPGQGACFNVVLPERQILD